MAVWQFDVQLMPDVIVPDAESYIAASMTDEGLVTDHWWRYNQPDPSFRDTIAAHYPPRESWADDFFQWGDQDAVLIESWIEDGIMSTLSARIDIRHVGREGIGKFCECVDNLSCHVYVMETQLVVPPSLELLLPHVRESRAARFCRDPHGFLDGLESEGDG